MTNRVALKTSIKLFSPSIITLLLLGGVSVNSRIGSAQSDIPNEIDYYESISGIYLDSTFPWSEFKDLDGYFLRVSRQGLRQESFEVLKTLGVCRMFVDKSRGVMWITGFVSVQMDEPKMFVYYWISPLGRSPLGSDSLLIGVVYRNARFHERIGRARKKGLIDL